MRTTPMRRRRRSLTMPASTMPTSSAASAACAGSTATPAYARIRAAHVAVVGVGGVGSWAAEALARSGVAALTLIDLDHVSESNINRQVQALGATRRAGQGRGAARSASPTSTRAATCAASRSSSTRQLAGAARRSRRRRGDRRLRPGAARKPRSRPGRCRRRRRSSSSVRPAASAGRRTCEVEDLGARHARPDARVAAPAPAQAPRRGAHAAASACAACSRAKPVRRPTRLRDRRRDVDSSLNCHGYGSSVGGDRDLRHGRRRCRARIAAGRAKASRRTTASYNRGLAGLLAQLVEQRTFNPLVVGSSPAQPTSELANATRYRI